VISLKINELKFDKLVRYTIRSLSIVISQRTFKLGKGSED